MIDEIKSPTTVGYVPMFPRPPTNSSVLQASVNYFMSLTNYLGQKTIVITGDHPVYEVLINIEKEISRKISKHSGESLYIYHFSTVIDFSSEFESHHRHSSETRWVPCNYKFYGHCWLSDERKWN